MKRTPTPFLTRCLSGALAVLIPLQVTLSCAPPGRARESLSRVQGNKTDLMFDTQKSDTSTDTSPGEGWGDRSDGNKTATNWAVEKFGPEYAYGLKEVPAEFPDLGYEKVWVAMGDTGLKLNASPPEKKGEPPQIEISLKAPSNTDKEDDEKRPSFPLNPGKLKTKTEVQSDVQKRLVEREKTAKERQGTLGKQSAQSEAKQKQAPPGELSKAVGGAEGEHGQAAGDIKGSLEKTVADARSGDTPSNPPSDPDVGASPGLPPNGIPGKRGEKLARTRERADEEAAAGKNPFSKDLAKAAKGLLDDAEKKAREGNPNKADEREKEARRLVDLAGIPPENMPPKPPKGEKPKGPNAPINERRGEAMGLGLDLYEAADDLSKGGFGGISEKTRKAAAIAIDVAIGVARFGALFDIPLSVMEAFGGLTLEATANGGIGFRTATKLEMAFGFAAIAGAGLAFAAGGWAAVAGVSVIGIAKGAAKGLERRLGKGAAKTAAEEAAAKASKVVEKLDSEGLEELEKALHKKFTEPDDAHRITEVIDAFDVGTIQSKVLAPGENIVVTRYYDGPNRKFGPWVTPEVFSSTEEAREKLAVLDSWSGMTNSSKFELKEGTRYFSGKTAPQGPYKGGSIQFYLPDPVGSLKELLP